MTQPANPGPNKVRPTAITSTSSIEGAPLRVPARSQPSGTKPVPGELSAWAEVAQFVGLLVPEWFAPPGMPVNANLHPGVSEVKRRLVDSVPPGEKNPTQFQVVESKKTEYFLHAFPSEFVHGLDPNYRIHEALRQLPSAWPSAVGQTGTVVRIAEYLVLTAKHVWENLGFAGQTPSGKLLYVVFDHQAQSLDLDAYGYPSSAERRDYNAWGRRVKSIGQVFRLVGSGATDAPEDDWVVLEIAPVSAAALPAWKPKVITINDLKNRNWVYGRDSTKPEERFDVDPLVVIGHPFGVPKQTSEGGNVLQANGKLFQHDLETFDGSSGSPIFRAAVGSGDPEIWLVGINIAGRSLPPSRDGESCNSTPHTSAPGYRNTENIAIDIRHLLKSAPAFPADLVETNKEAVRSDKEAVRSAPKTLYYKFSIGQDQRRAALDPSHRELPQGIESCILDSSNLLGGDAQLKSFSAWEIKADGTVEPMTRFYQTDAFNGNGTFETTDQGIYSEIVWTVETPEGEASRNARSFSLFEHDPKSYAFALRLERDANKKLIAKCPQQIPDQVSAATGNTYAFFAIEDDLLLSETIDLSNATITAVWYDKDGTRQSTNPTHVEGVEGGLFKMTVATGACLHSAKVKIGKDESNEVVFIPKVEEVKVSGRVNSGMQWDAPAPSTTLRKSSHYNLVATIDVAEIANLAKYGNVQGELTLDRTSNQTIVGMFKDKRLTFSTHIDSLRSADSTFTFKWTDKGDEKPHELKLPLTITLPQ